MCVWVVGSVLNKGKMNVNYMCMYMSVCLSVCVCVCVGGGLRAEQG